MAKPAPAVTPSKSKKRRARQILRARKAKRRNPDGGGGGPRANPPIVSDFTNVILPGFAAYAATRFVQRIAYTLAGKRWPRLAKHIHAATGVATFAGSWFFAHRVKAAARYHDGILLGTGIAALQGVAQTYVPKLAWVTADVNGAGAPASLQQAQRQAAEQQLPAGADGDEFAYLEEEARTVKAPRRGNPITSTLKVAAAAAGDRATDRVDTDILDELEDGEDIDDLAGGIFDGGSLSN